MSIVDSGVAGIGDVGGVGGVSQLGDLLVKRYREGEPCLEAPQIGFEPVTYRVTDSLTNSPSQKHGPLISYSQRSQISFLENAKARKS